MKSLSRLSRIFACTAAAVAVLSMAPAALRDAEASAMVQLDVGALTQRSDRILVGTVEDVRSHYLSDKRKMIVTDVTLRCDEEVLGVPAGERFVVRHLGGEVDGRGQRVFGEASYDLGERVLLFATLRRGQYYSVGMAQGALHVRPDETGLLRVRADVGGVELVRAAGGDAVSARPLGDVLRNVRSILKGK
jgi:hypothetical protein